MADSNNNFHSFLISEFNNVAKAHFNTIDTISVFFKHYLVMMSVPLTLMIIFIKFSSGQLAALNALKEYGVIPAIVMIIISFSGFFVMIYVCNLRMDVLLYARTVNGLRNYFYNHSAISLKEIFETATLPRRTHLPSYFEVSYFLPVVATFALINSFYFFLSMIMINLINIQIEDFRTLLDIYWARSLILAFAFLLIHFIAYAKIASYRAESYLKMHSIGVDIDGVLNKHRNHFCQLLEQYTGNIVDPEMIKTIPVHEDIALNVTVEDERKVFNTPEYWSEMPVLENATEVIRKLKNVFNYKVIVFSHRDWPQLVPLSAADKK